MRLLTNNVSRLLLAVAIAVGGLAMTGCNTAEGVGKDVEKAGEKLKDAAD